MFKIKNVEEQMMMSEEDLINYLNNLELTKEHILQMLDHNEIPYKKYESKKRLIEHYSKEIVMLGIFKRIANK